MRISTSFRTRVLEAVKAIPEGSVSTYKEIARKAGSPKAYRKVGSILKTNYDPSVPCHRVIRSDGTLGEYNRGKNKKYTLLRQENALPQ